MEELYRIATEHESLDMRYRALRRLILLRRYMNMNLEKPRITKMERLPVTDEQQTYLKGHYKLVENGKIKRSDLARQMNMSRTTLNHILLQMGLGS